MQKHGCNLSFVLFCFFMLQVAHAQNNAPIHPVDGEYITEWLVLGPFFPDDLDKDFLVGAGGEANVHPEAGDAVISAQGDTLRWRRHFSLSSIINLDQAVTQRDSMTVYAFSILQSAAEEKVQFLLGSNNGVAVWINGEQVHHNPVDRNVTVDEDVFEASLKAGANRCLIKITEIGGTSGFAVRAFPANRLVAATPVIGLWVDRTGSITQSGITSRWLGGQNWKYHAGNNADWADPEFDDSSWELVNPELRPNELHKSGWQGVGWFRLHIVIDSTLFNKPLGLSISQAGASQLYLDGTLIYTFGEHSDDWTGVPKVLSFEGKKRHVIAVRYSNFSSKKFQKAGFDSGFHIRLGNVNQMAEDRIGKERTLIGYQMFFTSLPLTVGILHLILFAFFPGLRQNLFFAIFLFFYAAAIFFDYQASLSTDIGQQLFFLRMHRAANVLFILFQLRFAYSLFYRDLPKQFWIISLAAFILGVRAIYKPLENYELFLIVTMPIIVIEINRVILIALFKKREGAWIIGLAFLVYYFFSTFDALMDAGIIVPFREMENPYAFGSIGFFIAMSVYLSRDFARSKMPIEQEKLALDLSVNGYHSWYQLYEKMAGELRVEYQENGKSETLSLGQ